MPIFPKVFTVLKYNKYRQEYKKYFSDKIKSQWEKRYNKIKNLNNFSGKTRPLLIRCQYDAIKMLCDVLEYCNIFICSPMNFDVDTMDSKDSIQDKCKFKDIFKLMWTDLAITKNIFGDFVDKLDQNELDEEYDAICTLEEYRNQ